MLISARPITDGELQADVETELEWDPTVSLASIGVSVHDRAVTLSGTVNQLSSRLAAVRAAKRVNGVRAIADDIVVEVNGHHSHTDHDIAEVAANAMKWNIEVPEAVRVTVRGGEVTLDGIVGWNFQRRAAQRAVEHLAGVVKVDNKITLQHAETPDDIHRRIADALQRSADVDADSIAVSAEGGAVRLTGSVASWSERQCVEDAAWAARGVTDVRDDLVIR